MPGWAIILIVFVVIGAAIGFFASMDDSTGMNAPQGCLAGAFAGGAGGLGCLTMILQAILPLIIAALVFVWLFEGCS